MGTQPGRVGTLKRSWDEMMAASSSQSVEQGKSTLLT
jgi:hypothetical protein